MLLFANLRYCPRARWLGVVLALCALPVSANPHRLTAETGDLVGEVRITYSRESDTLMDIARTYKVGYQGIRGANPGVDALLPGEGTRILVPTQAILPDVPREGLVLNRSEMRLYFYHPDPDTGEPLVSVYPVGLGRVDRQTPTGRSRVRMKLENPAWYPTENVRADYASRGRELPIMVPPGPDNPLGQYAMMLDIPGYLIHGTNRPDGIGMRVSQGCVRLYPEDIAELIYKVPLQTPVEIIDQPFKLGIQAGQLWLEVHPQLYPEGEEQQLVSEEQRLINQIVTFLQARGDSIEGRVNWEKVTRALREASGLPVMIAGGESVASAP